jgi:DNA-binding PadR family transcriptional regulator
VVIRRVMTMTPVADHLLYKMGDGKPRSGAQICDLTGINPGRLYPLLMELEIEGKLTSKWEEGTYPRRRLYQIRQSATV